MMKSQSQFLNAEMKESKFSRSSKLVKFLFYLLIVMIYFIFSYVANSATIINIFTFNFTTTTNIFISILLISLLIHTIVSYSDPGFIPTNSALISIEINYIKSDINADVESDSSDDGLIRNIPKLNKSDSEISNISESSMLINCKRDGCKSIDEIFKGSCDDDDDITQFCSACNIDRPARSRHCKCCGRCVYKFDHHCPFFNNCIGVNNHRLFLAYIYSKVIITLWLFIEVLIADTGGRILNWVIKIYVCAMMLVGLILKCLLLGFHTYLAFSNQTTREFIDTTKPDYKIINYSEGWYKNIYMFCCGIVKDEWK